MTSKHNLSVLAALAALAFSSGAGAQTLTRIETHAFYGATVTVEEGVRVFRPLPSTGHMIINPGGRTPVSVNLSESVNHYIGAPGVVSGGGGGEPAYYGGGGGYGLPWLPGDGRGRRTMQKGKLSGNPGPGGAGMKHIRVGAGAIGHHGGARGGAGGGGGGGHGH